MRIPLQILQFLSSHPIARKNLPYSLFRVLYWHFITFLAKDGFIFKFIGSIRLLAFKGNHSVSGNFYTGLFSYEEMGFLIHFLRPNDIFIDVGANVGIFSLLASSICEANSFAFEPSASAYNTLIDHVNLNRLSTHIKCYNNCVSVDSGSSLSFLEGDSNLISCVAKPNINSNLKIKNAVSSTSISLDDVFSRTLNFPTLLKIDTEGYENFVLAGATHILKSSNLKALIIELKGHGSDYGINEMQIYAELLDLGFVHSTYDPQSRLLNRAFPITSTKDNKHEIFVRDLDYVIQRVAKSKPIYIRGLKL